MQSYICSLPKGVRGRHQSAAYEPPLDSPTTNDKHEHNDNYEP
jgi:hypothetical protein